MSILTGNNPFYISESVEILNIEPDLDVQHVKVKVGGKTLEVSLWDYENSWKKWSQKDFEEAVRTAHPKISKSDAAKIAKALKSTDW